MYVDRHVGVLSVSNLSACPTTSCLKIADAVLLSAVLQFAERLEGMLDRGAVHPKMERLQAILVDHFTALHAGGAPGGCDGAQMRTTI